MVAEATESAEGEVPLDLGLKKKKKKKTKASNLTQRLCKRFKVTGTHTERRNTAYRCAMMTSLEMT